MNSRRNWFLAVVTVGILLFLDLYVSIRSPTRLPVNYTNKAFSERIAKLTDVSATAGSNVRAGGDNKDNEFFTVKEDEKTVVCDTTMKSLPHKSNEGTIGRSEVCKLFKEREPILFQNQTASSSPVDTTQENSRIAYLITVNATSPRTVHTKTILRRAGFTVEIECATRLHDGVLSNKIAQLSIYHKIVADKKRPWGYVFEDDIMLAGKSSDRGWDNKVNFSVEKNLVGKGAMESEHSFAMYLGICGKKRQQSWPLNRFCGRCAHAYGLSREGAKKLLQFTEFCRNWTVLGDSQTRYMDVLMDVWCTCQGGFPVSHASQRSNQFRDHFGTFSQDRRRFPSGLGPKPLD